MVLVSITVWRYGSGVSLEVWYWYQYGGMLWVSIRRYGTGNRMEGRKMVPTARHGFRAELNWCLCVFVLRSGGPA